MTEKVTQSTQQPFPALFLKRYYNINLCGAFHVIITFSENSSDATCLYLNLKNTAKSVNIK